jgi:hypothetical protein
VSQYIPSINEGFIPEDGGWTASDSEPVLLLSVPQLSEIIDKKWSSLSYAWLFDKSKDAYIFCFQLNKKEEFALLFEAQFAGQLLLEKEAYETFSVAITDVPFEQLKEDSPYLYIQNVQINRQPIAGW